MRRLKDAMMLLISADTPLGAEWLDHPLVGTWKGYGECHIGGDFLLIYRIYENNLIVFTRVGSHSELFKN